MNTAACPIISDCSTHIRTTVGLATIVVHGLKKSNRIQAFLLFFFIFPGHSHFVFLSIAKKKKKKTCGDNVFSI